MRGCSGHNARPGDVVIINGHIGDHGMAILSKREGLHFESPLISDSAPLNALVYSMLQVSDEIHALRDPTRGRVATALNEVAARTGVGIHLFEEHVPVSPSVKGACERLGLDPLYVANEGKCLVIASKMDAEKVLRTMKKNYVKGSVIMGEVTSENPESVLLKTKIGGTRILSMLTGELLPRIC